MSNETPRPVIAKVEFLTRTRDDLFTLTRRLMSSMSPLALQDAGKPVIISVDGSYAAGKKIIPDAARQHMLPGTTDFNGRENDYELWRGRYNDKDFELDFLNYEHWVQFLEHRSEQKETGPATQHTAVTARSEFLGLRRHGGITFLHNDEATQKDIADITIQIEDSSQATAYEFRPGEVTPAFNVLSVAYPWARHVKIEVRNENLMRHESFAREIAALQLPSEKISNRFNNAAKLVSGILPAAATQILAHGNVPIYGVNIARPA